MTGKIADTTFTTGPTDDVAAVDVYQTTDTAPKTKTTGQASAEAAKSVASTLKGGLTIKDLASATNIENGRASISKSDAKDKAMGVAGGALGDGLASIQDAAVNDILKAAGFKDENDLAKAAGGEGVPGTGNKAGKGLSRQDIIFTYNTVQTLKKGDFKSATGVASMLNAIAGNDRLAGVLNLDTQFAVLGKIMQKVNELGIPEAIDMILAKMADDKERRRLLLENLRSAVINCDMYSITKAIEYVGAAGVLARVPDFVNMFLTFYKFPAGSPVATVPLRDQMINIVAAVDPAWFTAPRDAGTISDLEPFTYCSFDAEANFMLSDTHKLRMMIARSYGSVELIDLAKRYFPYLPLIPPRLAQDSLPKLPK
jgi:hypothetical protein